MDLVNSVCVVTGGSSGLGAATARRFYAAGARVVICNRDAAMGEGMVATLGANARFVRTDVADERDADRAIGVAVAEFGAVHVLVNCAGIAKAEPILGKQGVHRLDSFLSCLQINLVGTFNMVRFAAQAMSSNLPNPTGERGVVVNTASIVAFEGQAGHTAYAASYGGVISMTLPLARELASSGIRVMAIAPGPFLTPRLESVSANTLTALAEAVPFPRRLGKPDEFAQLAEHIVENEMLNGETIRLDGATRFASAEPSIRVDRWSRQRC